MFLTCVVCMLAFWHVPVKAWCAGNNDAGEGGHVVHLASTDHEVWHFSSYCEAKLWHQNASESGCADKVHVL